FSWNAFLDQLDSSVCAGDLGFFRCVRPSRCSLNFRHATSQDLANDIILRSEAAGIQAVLERPPERQNTDHKNRDPNHHFVQRKSVRRQFTSQHIESFPAGQSAASIPPSSYHQAPCNRQWPAHSFRTAKGSTPLEVPWSK